MAAGEAIGLLADAFPHTTAADMEQHCLACGGGSIGSEGEGGGGGGTSTAFAVTFQDFNLRQILDKGQPLLASGGQVCVFQDFRNKCKCSWLDSFLSLIHTFSHLHLGL